ncbi:MAG: flagellar hook protein FlgE [Leptothrix sp. (in: Bacteria)]|nr:flagellar hook protein FlgE [Leptothrix sp. (in: b-proteobacteria)]
MGLQQGLSGLNASSKNLEIIGNNIANANTYGTKVARAEFADVYAAALNGAGANAVGIGTNMAAVAQQFTQGNITTTANPMDLAINGAGFFQLTDGKSPTTYSRNGQFKVDREGFIVNGSSRQLMGYAANAQGVVQPGQAVPLQLPTGGVPPKASTGMDIEMNLDSRQAATVPPSGAAIDFNDAATYNNATSLTVFDAKGQPVAMTFYFQKAATDSWNVYATANGESVLGAPGAPDPITTIDFASDGSAPVSPLGAISFDIPGSVNSAGSDTLPITGFTFDPSAATQFGSAFGVTDIKQDGFSAGLLVAISVESNGIITARYSNGQSRPAGQIEVANFRNPQGLQPQGDNQWANTFASGDPITGVPGDGNLGVLQAGALEESNVDLTGELVNLITAQRIYQANAQTIKAQDQVLQTLVNLR